MTDIFTMLENLRRPALLLRAARYGMHHYTRGYDQKRLTNSMQVLSPAQAVMTLVGFEQEQEEKRKTGDATYSVTRHIELLIALLAEARLLRDPT